MSSTPSDLQALRQRLDGIDDRLQDLLIDRAQVVSMVAASKKGGNQPAFQPAREAEIIRRLVARHHGPLPVATLVRMWREMLAATVSLQSPFSVAIFAPADQPGYWELARDHYGSNTPMTAYNAVGPVIRAVCGRDRDVGVLPMPQAGEPDPWWPRLLSPADDGGPRVIARLPFGAPGNARANGAEALTIGHGAVQDSGLDRTLLALECARDLSRAQILKLLSAQRLGCTFFAACGHRDALKLIEVEGFVPISDARLDDLRAELGAALHRLVPIGGYAVPLAAAVLAPKD